MDLDAMSAYAAVVAAVGQIAGTIAVVVTIVYLARQLQINTQAVRMASYQGDVGNSISLTGAVFLHPEFADFFYRAQRDPASLNPVEGIRWHCFMLSVFRHYDGLFMQHREGAIHAELWHGYHAAMINWLRSPGWADWFQKNASSFSSALQGAVLEHIQAHRAEAVAATASPQTAQPTAG